ncbi:hypothetical protein Tco_1045219 [Tanacetum coccineum]|uniref:Uncharacterized protein n=1 Tax=Tanacetum coccineum TaxID=301880 RepID=A0ABQ5GT76_9ASTR
MLLNVDQLQNQLDKDNFQEDGSMAAFLMINRQFQKFIDLKFTLDYDSQMSNKYFVEYTRIEVKHFRDTLLQHMGNVKKFVAERTCHQRQYDRRVNKRQMQTQESKVDAGADDADIKPIYDEEPMAEVGLTKFSRMEAYCIALELKYQNQALKSGQHGQILNETSNKAKIKKEIDVLETMNIELEYSVAKLLKEDETLKKHYKDVYDSIKITRSKTIEHTTSLLANNADLKAQIQEKVFAIVALKNDLRKLKGNSVDTKFAKTSVLGKPVLQLLRNQSVVRQLNAFKSERPQMSKPRLASQVDVNNNLSIVKTSLNIVCLRKQNPFAKPDHISLTNMNAHKLLMSVSTSKLSQEQSFNPKKEELRVWPQTLMSNDVCSQQFKPRSSMSNDKSIKPAENSKHRQKSWRYVSFGPLFDEYFNGENQVVLKSSAVTTTDASNKRQQPDSTSSTSTLATTVTANGNFDL